MTTLLHNAYVVVMDDAATEHESGWVLLADDLVAQVGSGPQPEADKRIDAFRFTASLAARRTSVTTTAMAATVAGSACAGLKGASP